jgi:hypothetical protein
VQRAGSDTIGNPYSLISVPVDTSFVIYAPGEYYEWNASGNVWYALNYNLPASYFNFSAYMNTSQNLVANGTVIAYNTEIRDPSDSWNSSTYRYTAKVPGVYKFYGQNHCQLGTSTTGMAITARKFNSSNTLLEGYRQGSLTLTTVEPATLTTNQQFTLAIGDYVNFTINTGAGTVYVYGNANTFDAFGNMSGTLVTRV